MTCKKIFKPLLPFIMALLMIAGVLLFTSGEQVNAADNQPNVTNRDRAD